MPRYRFPAEAGLAPAGSPPDPATILARLEAIGLPRQGLAVNLRGDTAILSGPVADAATRELLVLAVGNLQGVGAVEDRLTVTAQRGLLDSLGSFAHLPAGSAGTAPAEAAVHAAQPEPDDRFGPGGSLFHTVAPGESLASLGARHELGADALLEANRPVLSGPEAVQPGLVLRLPQR